MKNDTYESAKTGGRHSGLLRQLDTLGPRQLEKSIRSLQANIDEHQAKISSPERIVLDWDSRSKEYQAGLLKKWQAEIENSKEQITVIEGFIHEHRK